MSDLTEMAKEFSRALELGDTDAANEIARQIMEDARAIELEAIADDFYRAYISGDKSRTSVILAGLATRASAIDSANHDVFGAGYSQAMDIIVWGHEVGSRRN